ncbi:MAG: class I SAM-dependent methyltransferase [Desulfobacterales bacterium]|nr:class I SAM-dependent methyltransferase [Desulfobacterales bacterium]
MVKLQDEFQISEHYSLKEYDDYMETKPLDQRIALDFIIDRFQKTPDLKVAEIAGGTGRFTKNLLHIFPKLKLTIIEPDKNCCLWLKKIKKKYNQIKIIQSYAENFRSRTKFDILVMTTAFHHIPFKTKDIFLKNMQNLLKKNGMFLLGDEFIAEYKTMKERTQILRKSYDIWIKTAKRAKDEKELKMALDMEKVVFRKDFGGEFFICPSKFESYIKKSGFKIKGKINVTNTDPLDFENYFYLLMK